MTGAAQPGRPLFRRQVAGSPSDAAVTTTVRWYVAPSQPSADSMTSRPPPPSCLKRDGPTRAMVAGSKVRTELTSYRTVPCFVSRSTKSPRSRWASWVSPPPVAPAWPSSNVWPCAAPALALAFHQLTSGASSGGSTSARRGATALFTSGATNCTPDRPPTDSRTGAPGVGSVYDGPDRVESEPGRTSNHDEGTLSPIATSSARTLSTTDSRANPLASRCNGAPDEVAR